MSGVDVAALSAAVAGRTAMAAKLFDEIRAASQDGIGVTRPSWSATDQAAADILAGAAREIGLAVDYDRAGNLRCTLPGKVPPKPVVMMGSHLDSVQTGGHFDGLAGFIAGLVVQAALRDIGWVPDCDIVSLGIRGEESVWFGIPFIGSRLALGSLPHDMLDSLRRGDTNRTLAEHMSDVDVDVDALRNESAPEITPAGTRAFLELHIEQGPVLVGEGVQVAIPTMIRGNVRWPYASCTGRYDHSGATPRAYRQDAVLAVSELLHGLDEFWISEEARGVPDTVFTVGKLYTDSAQHGMTKVPGRCDFTLNFGGTTEAFLDACRNRVQELAAEIGPRRRVEFALGECVGNAPAPLDAALRTILEETAVALNIPTRRFATVGHDAAVFHRAGIPAAMVLVRNAHGSHNPEEAMDLDDFCAGVQVLAAAAASLAGKQDGETN
ncbi:MAG: hydantoinase/carbamoylase family amidase [Proteobacteria bacterium]|nr:hydantoinase/carbamoylase family amidase [Pseudomonadota bacterium]MDA1357312.1 hydantoinase/carbamoylase family amidase [Pseudomonadota bacterium]